MLCYQLAEFFRWWGVWHGVPSVTFNDAASQAKRYREALEAIVVRNTCRADLDWGCPADTDGLSDERIARNALVEDK